MGNPGMSIGGPLIGLVLCVVAVMLRRPILEVERALERGLACGGVWGVDGDDVGQAYRPLQIGVCDQDEDRPEGRAGAD